MLPWDSFLARYQAMARALARRLCANPSDADDVVQEALVALHGALEREPERFESTAHARNYFLRSVQNLAHKEHRKPRPARLDGEPTLPDPAPGTSPARDPEALQAALAELAPEERDLIVARFLERKTLAELSRGSGLPISTLHSRERALLRRLQDRLDGGDSR